MEKLSKQKFYEIYIKDLLPILEQFEPLRKKMLMQLILSVTLCFLLGYISYLLRGLDTEKPLFHFMTVLVPIAGVCLIYPFKVVFKNKLKRKCMPAIRKCSKNITWGYPTEKSLIKRSNLFEYYDAISYDDSFMMKYQNVKFTVSETILHLVQAENYKEPSQSHVVFRGAIITIPANKKIKANTLIFSKESILKPDIYLMFLILEIFFLIIYLLTMDCSAIVTLTVVLIWHLIYWMCNYKKNSKPKLEKIKLEDVIFDKKFDVYSKDQIEARYLLTTAFIDRLNNLKIAFRTKSIRCSFFDNNIMFALKTSKDLFEIGNLFTSLTDPKNFEDFYLQLSSIYEIIDHFKLNERTGL